MSNAEVGGACIGLIVGVVIFFVTRELWCWYLKINRVVEVLEDMQLVLRNIDKHVAESLGVMRKTQRDAAPPTDEGPAFDLNRTNRG